MLPDALPTTMAHKRRDQFMLASAQALQMAARRSHIGRLVEPDALADQQLISANHQRIGGLRGHAHGLGIGQHQRGIFGGNTLGLRGFLDGGFIHARHACLKPQPSTFQHRAPRCGS